MKPRRLLLVPFTMVALAGCLAPAGAIANREQLRELRLLCRQLDAELMRTPEGLRCELRPGGEHDAEGDRWT